MSADDEVEASSGTKPDELDPEILRLLLHMSCSVATLCSERKHASGKAGSSHFDLFELLDVLPECHPRTRHALLILIGERSMLDGCNGRWKDLKKMLSTYLSG